MIITWKIYRPWHYTLTTIRSSGIRFLCGIPWDDVLCSQHWPDWLYVSRTLLKVMLQIYSYFSNITILAKFALLEPRQTQKLWWLAVYSIPVYITNLDHRSPITETGWRNTNSKWDVRITLTMSLIDPTYKNTDTSSCVR